MDYYLDIRLRPDPEFVPPIVMAALYAKLHRALVALGTMQIGVSFPAHTKNHLGDVLRLHGLRETLQALQAQTWMGAMAEMVQTLPIAPVPPAVQYRTVRRVQTQNNPDRVKRRLVQRLVQREGITQGQAETRISVKAAPALDTPYIEMKSASTGQRFKLFIEHSPLQPHPSAGSFSAYGLSPAGTIPWF